MIVQHSSQGTASGKTHFQHLCFEIQNPTVRKQHNHNSDACHKTVDVAPTTALVHRSIEYMNSGG